MTNSQIKSLEKLKKDFNYAQYIDVSENKGYVCVCVGEITISSFFIIGKRGKVEEIEKED